MVSKKCKWCNETIKPNENHVSFLNQFKLITINNCSAWRKSEHDRQYAILWRGLKKSNEKVHCTSCAIFTLFIRWRDWIFQQKKRVLQQGSRCTYQFVTKTKHECFCALRKLERGKNCCGSATVTIVTDCRPGVFETSYKYNKQTNIFHASHDTSCLFHSHKTYKNSYRADFFCFVF